MDRGEERAKPPNSSTTFGSNGRPTLAPLLFFFLAKASSLRGTIEETTIKIVTLISHSASSFHFPDSIYSKSRMGKCKSGNTATDIYEQFDHSHHVKAGIYQESIDW